MFPREEGKDCAGSADLVSIVEMVGTRIVEIDGAFDEAQAQRSRVEVEIVPCIARDCGDVMKA
jgi:hypothetical protein